MSTAQNEMTEPVATAAPDSAPDEHPASAGGKPSRGLAARPLERLPGRWRNRRRGIADLRRASVAPEHETTPARREQCHAGPVANDPAHAGGDREVAQLWVAGLNGEALDAVQRLRFESLLSEHTWAAFHIWDRTQAGIFETGEFARGAGPPLARWLCTPGGAPWWAKTKVRYPPAFVRDVDAAMTRLTPEERANCPAPQ
jgi:hypothetical protein